MVFASLGALIPWFSHFRSDNGVNCSGGGRMNLSGKGIGNTGDEKTGVERGIVGRSEITGMDGAGAVVTTLI